MVFCTRRCDWRQSSQRTSSGTPWDLAETPRKHWESLCFSHPLNAGSRTSSLKPLGGLGNLTVIRKRWKTLVFHTFPLVPGYWDKRKSIVFYVFPLMLGCRDKINDLAFFVGNSLSGLIPRYAISIRLCYSWPSHTSSEQDSSKNLVKPW